MNKIELNERGNPKMKNKRSKRKRPNQIRQMTFVGSRSMKGIQYVRDLHAFYDKKVAAKRTRKKMQQASKKANRGKKART